MACVEFTSNVSRHLECNAVQVTGNTVAKALAQTFTSQPKAKSYFLDDQGAVRKHVVIFLDGYPIKDRQNLSDKIEPDSEILIMQALSGG